MNILIAFLGVILVLLLKLFINFYKHVNFFLIANNFL